MLAGRSLAVQLRPPVSGHRVHGVRLDVRRPFRAVEDVVRGEVDERRSECGDVSRASDVDGRRALRIVLRALDVGPGRCVEYQIQVTVCYLARGRVSDVPGCSVQRNDIVAGEGLGERDAELAAGAGDHDPAATALSR